MFISFRLLHELLYLKGDLNKSLLNVYTIWLKFYTYNGYLKELTKSET